MDEKIAILTLYYRNYNYGGLLQAYALQKSIENLGYQAEQISYILESGYEGWNPLKSLIKKPVAMVYHLLKYGNWFKQYILRRKKIDAFANLIPHSKVVTARSITKLKNRYDCFVCGSDQIWNPIGWQRTFFFDFLDDNKKRISYAASIARNQITEEQYEFIQPYLDKFSAISVREQNSVDLIKKKFPQLNVQHMPDPVFLLDEREWRTFVGENKDENEPYVYAYFLGENKENRNKAIEYASKHNMRIQFASYLDFPSASWDMEHSDLLMEPMGVSGFLQSISSAELVITDSFHAAAFSCIFKTPFFVLPRFNSTDKNSMNSRLQNLVQEIGITRCFTEILSDHYKWSDSEIDLIEANLKRLKDTGLCYLNENI